MATNVPSGTLVSPNQPGSDPMETGLFRRVTLRFIPFLMVCYFVCYLSRVNLGFAALQMNGDLRLSPTVYGLGVGLFFLTYCVCEIPSNLMLHKFGASRWITRIMLSWGVCAVAMAFITGVKSFYVMRLLLGAAEAGFYPGVLFFLTCWYPAARRARIMAVFIAAIPISGIIGSPLSGALLSLHGLGLHGWQWLFLIEGLPAVLLAPAVLFLIQDSPSDAKWLSAPEREWLTSKMSAEQRKVESKRVYSMLQCLTSPLVLLMAAMYFSNVCLLNGVTFFMPTIVKGFGMTNSQTGLVMAIPSALALIALLWWGRRSDKHQERYGHAAFANLMGGVALLLSMVIHNPVARVSLLSLTFACTLAFTAPFWAIPGSFLTGRAAAGGIATVSAIGVLGGFIAPWIIGAIRDRTGDFRVGFVGVACLAMIVSIVFYLIGRRREREPIG